MAHGREGAITAVYMYAKVAGGATITHRPQAVMYQNPQYLISVKLPLSIFSHGAVYNM